MIYSVLGDGSGVAPDLAALISSLPEKITVSGEQLALLMDEKFAALQDLSVSVGESKLEILDVVLSLFPAQRGEDGSIEISGVNFPLILGLAGGLHDVIGVDLAAFDDVVELLLGQSFSEITSEDFDAAATPLADIRIGVKNDADGKFERAWLKRSLGEDNFELSLSGVSVNAGGTAILNAEKFAQAKAGALSLTGRTYIGSLEVFSDIKISLDLSSNAGNKILITGGSAVASITGSVVEGAPASTREFYALEGWYLDEGLTQKAQFPYEMSGNTTFYAKWTLAENAA